MTTLPVLVKDEINELCTLHAFIMFLERETEITTFKRWKNNFEVMHKTCEDMIMERWLRFKDAGALKRIRDEVVGAKILVTQKGNNYIKGNEEEFKNRVSADDMYKLAEMLQETKCQNCTKNKGECTLFGLYNKYNFDKYAEKPDKGICPYSVPNERLSQAYEAEKGIKQCLLMYGERLEREAKLHPTEKEGYKAAIENLKIITNALGSEFKLVEVE